MIKEFSFEDITRLIKKRPKFSLAVGLIIATFFLVTGSIFPQIKNIFDNKQTLEKETKSLSLLKQKLVQLDQVKYDPGYTKSAQIVSVAIPNTKPLLEFLASLDQVTRATGVELSGLELTPGELGSQSAGLSKKNQQAGVDSLPVKFKAMGNFDQVSQFMELLEKIAPFTTISEFSITEGAAKPSSPNTNGDQAELDESKNKVSVNLSCQVYFANLSVKSVVNATIPTLTNQDNLVLEKLQEFTQIELPQQKSINGGLEDLFGLPKIEELYQVQ